ncbi:MAG: hypothetical protein Pars2KO_30020 [Parasphingorhabdus sp.]
MESVNDSLNPLYRLILSYAKAQDRPRIGFLFAFDLRLAEIIRSTSEPMIGQIRLAWWRDILNQPVQDRLEGEPLVSTFNILEREGLSNKNLQRIIDGWETMLEDFPWDDRQFDVYAENRGNGYFGFALNQLEISDEMASISKLWALWDFARHCSDPDMREQAIKLCRAISNELQAPNFDRNGRPLSILCKLAMRDVKSEQLSETLYRPSTAAKIIWHGVSGL